MTVHSNVISLCNKILMLKRLCPKARFVSKCQHIPRERGPDWGGGDTHHVERHAELCGAELYFVSELRSGFLFEGPVPVFKSTPFTGTCELLGLSCVPVA